MSSLKSAIFFIICVELSNSDISIYTEHSFGAYGRVLCKNIPINMAVVDLFHRTYFFRNDQIDSAITNETGTFALNGRSKTLFDLDPRLSIVVPQTSSKCAGTLMIRLPAEQMRSNGVIKFHVGDLELSNNDNFIPFH